MNQEVIKQKSIVNEFVKAISTGDINEIAILLSPVGIFDIELPDQDTLEVNKARFLDWLSTPLKCTKITSVEFDQCLFCKIGNPVVLFNQGTFPREAKMGERPKSGLMLDFDEQGLINQIQFCFTFLHQENESKFTINAQKVLDYMNDGLSADEAFDKLKEDKKEDGECSLPF